MYGRMTAGGDDGDVGAKAGPNSRALQKREEIAMKTTEHGIESSKDVENVYHMRLMALLQELVREKGYKGAARVLEIDPQTVTEAAKSGQLTRRVRQALERALQEGVGSAAERQRRRNEEIEGRVEALEKGFDELGKDLRRRMASVEGEVGSLRRDGPQGTGAGQAGAGPSPDGTGAEDAGAARAGRKPPTKPSMRREYPDLVTREPDEEDEEIFGDAWPLVVEWRGLKDAHPNEGDGLAWLTAQERLLEVELALLEEHGMTLPPEKQPLRGLDRSGQVNWRRTALSDTRRERKKAELLNRASFGLWRK